VRPAVKFGPSSLQFPLPQNSIYYGGESEFSEDCLYLNIYTGSSGDDRPVLVWFHFGAFIFGSSSNPLYDGTSLATEGLTVVTVNYRLGRLGFLAHPELSDESSHKTSGNYGIMDQIAALEWVQRNIKAFGGDPNNVTIGGASAGGASVHILRCSPLAKGLFSKAICESGPGVAPALDGHGHLAAYTTLASGVKAGVDLLATVGVSSIAELRKTPAKTIMAAYLPRAKGQWKSEMWHGSTSLSLFDTANPIVDGYVLPESPLATLLSGRMADVPLLAGNSVDEATSLPHLDSLAEYRAYAKETFSKQEEEFLRLYPASADSEVRSACLNLLGDQVFVWPTWISAEIQAAKMSSPVWYYRFARAPPITRETAEGSSAGVFHCAGVPYAFGNLNHWKDWDWADADKALSKDMLETWVRFMTSGNPNATDMESGTWPALSSTRNKIKIWDFKPRIEVLESRFDQMSAFWKAHYGVNNHLSTQ
jgi:para-nitrobenzyl esterase